MKQFESKVVLITGGSFGGMGAQFAIDFASEGAKVVILGRNQETLQQTKTECIKANKNCKVHIIIKDLSVPEHWERIIDETVEVFGRLDVLVNNAANSKFVANLDKMEIEAHQNVLTTNTSAPLFLSKYAVPYLSKNKGCIVNISTSMTQTVAPQFLSYCMSKTALENMSISLAKELAPKGIRVNIISPGACDTASIRSQNLPKETMEYLSSVQPIGGVLHPNSISNAVLFLASDKARYITGSNLHVDGGYKMFS